METMEWTTLPKLAVKVGLTDKVLRQWAEEGLLPTIQNPVAQKNSRQRRSRYRVPLDERLANFLIKQLGFSTLKAEKTVVVLYRERKEERSARRLTKNKKVVPE
jgi:hypothetical protein